MISIQNELPPIFSALPYLPQRISCAVSLFCEKNRGLAEQISEIRLRKNRALSLSVLNTNYFPDINGNRTNSRFLFCTEKEISDCILNFCENSVHSHENELQHGYISAAGGFRIGIASYSVPGSIGIYDISGICIRIPRKNICYAKSLLELTGIVPMLIYSPPGIGKTTLLRDLIRELTLTHRMRVGVADTRGELETGEYEKTPLADYIFGKEKGTAIEELTRTMSPQMIICDEIGGEDEAKAILVSQNSGVPLIATAHADSFPALLSRPHIKTLHDSGVFSVYVGLTRKEGQKMTFDIRGSGGNPL